MKKGRGSASERASAMVLGGSICSKDKGKYSGPLFARKKNNYLGKFLFLMVLGGVGISFWERGRKKIVAMASSFFKPESSKAQRSLASESIAQPLVETPAVESEEQKIEQ